MLLLTCNFYEQKIYIYTYILILVSAVEAYFGLDKIYLVFKMIYKTKMQYRHAISLQNIYTSNKFNIQIVKFIILKYS